LEKNIKNSAAEAKKKLRELSGVQFACEADAVAAGQRLSKQLKYHNLNQIKPGEIKIKSGSDSTNNNEQVGARFKIKAEIELDVSVVTKETMLL
jgi:hypothetical protein